MLWTDDGGHSHTVSVTSSGTTDANSAVPASQAVDVRQQYIVMNKLMKVQ